MSCVYVVLYSLFLMINTVCVKKVKASTFNTENILTILDKKLDDGTLEYNDIFETDYGIYNERTVYTLESLDRLVDKLSGRVKKEKHIGNQTIDVDDILQKNIDKIVDKLVDEKYFKYGIYGTDKKRWFTNDERQKAPFNFFQQQFLLLASAETLKKLTILSVSRMMNGERVYVANYGSFWVLYGKNNHLAEGFTLLKHIVNGIHEKYFAQKQQLNQQDLNVLKTVVSMKKFNDIKTGSFGEYVSKTMLISKSSGIVKRCEVILINNGDRI